MRLPALHIDDLRELLEPCVAEVDSDEGQAQIHNDDTHVTELWHDGEITFTKSGDLYGARSRHQRNPPLLPENDRLWGESGDGNQKRIVVDDTAEEIIETLRDNLSEAVDKTVQAHGD